MRFFGLIGVLIVFRVNTFDCANKSATFGHLARGRDAAAGQFPYVVRLKTRSAFNSEFASCAGALIGPTWLLTAAHCVAHINLLKVYLGCLFKDVPLITYIVPIAEIKLHPKFKSSTLQNDIALIKIPPTRLCAKIGAVPLPSLGRSWRKYEDAYAIGCGWGQTSADGTMSTRLQWGRLKIMREKDCPKLNRMCTVMSTKLATPCQGDSGGPLVLETTGKLVGIASMAAKRCVSGKPAIYTRVGDYLLWIKSVSHIFY